MKKIVVLLVVLLGCMPVTAFAQKQFFFKDGRFVVAQFTDLHWMPGSAKCAETAGTIRAVPAAAINRTSGHCYTEWGCGDR